MRAGVLRVEAAFEVGLPGLLAREAVAQEETNLQEEEEDGGEKSKTGEKIEAVRIGKKGGGENVDHAESQ